MRIICYATTILYFTVGGVIGALKRTYKTTDVTAKFDDLTAPPLPEVGAEIGTYKGLFYNFDLINLSGPASGIAAQSSPNAGGTNFILSQALRGTPYVSVEYPNSKTVAFDLKSFYFGCSAPTGSGALQLAEQCSILVAGFNAANKEVAVATYTFTPELENVLRAPMIPAILPKEFVGLHNVTIVQDDPIEQVLFIDTVKSRLYTTV
ncbi:MAG: hypothetical protein LQ342_003996 [Letrouitia transgressa]|nr:MAG: hypothetical protein LQ342_003996 [Letrouitia transgressa]